MIGYLVRIMSISVICSAAVLLVGCGDVSGPSPAVALCGWAVGSSSGAHGLIIHTVDGGNNWVSQASPECLIESVSAVDSLHAWAAGGIANGYGTVLYTQDAGETWDRVQQSSGIPNEGMLGICALSANDVWVVGSDNTILHTTDGGGYWAPMSDPAYSTYNMTSITIVNTSNIWVCGATANDAVIIHSTDGGTSWTAEGDSTLLSGYPLISISAFDQDHCWTVGHGYTVANTKDSGLSWNLSVPDSLNRTPFSDDANGVCPTSADRAWVAMDYGKLYFTADGGDSWTQQQVPDSAGGYYLLRTCATDQNTAWTVGVGPGNGIILHTTDGTTWTSQTAPANSGLNDVSFVGSYH